MSTIEGFRKKCVKIMPNFLRTLLRPFWRMVFIPYNKIRLMVNSKLCVKMCVGWERADFIYNKTFDYVRHSSLELVAREINENQVQGNVAELGVFQGEFAQYINRIFPDRKLYLFDTFEGFVENDMKNEKINDYHFTDAITFDETSTNIVLKKMKYKENCVIKKGYFPATAKDVEDTFAFVNIDVDLSEPTYNGLCWFYPRLEKGGYIFVHDYNHRDWTGAKVGVKKFAAEYDIPYFPLSDQGCSVVFMK